MVEIHFLINVLYYQHPKYELYHEHLEGKTNDLISKSEIGQMEKQEFRRTDFGSRLLSAEGEGGGGTESEECV